ncbi:hypothetical protein ARMGADRAFT_446822 [Armillaria gallica]|uniref:Uncharacterized protein n=1 Tax=Armillaria gallica TaxID=47427 RepID=A0A2H3DFK6_ARMGA|nr:hypothetical protein ARMGADRAFT_446822 [Armillaria gallica]
MAQGIGQDSRLVGECWMMDLPASKVLTSERWMSPTHHQPLPALSLPLPCLSPALFLHPPSRAPFELGYIVAGRLWWSDLTPMLGINVQHPPSEGTTTSKWWRIFRMFSTEVQVRKIASAYLPRSMFKLRNSPSVSTFKHRHTCIIGWGLLWRHDMSTSSEQGDAQAQA